MQRGRRTLGREKGRDMSNHRSECQVTLLCCLLGPKSHDVHAVQHYLHTNSRAVVRCDKNRMLRFTFIVMLKRTCISLRAGTVLLRPLVSTFTDFLHADTSVVASVFTIVSTTVLSFIVVNWLTAVVCTPESNVNVVLCISIKHHNIRQDSVRLSIDGHADI